MATVFISHSSSDRAAVEHLVEQLHAYGFAAMFVDFDPDAGHSRRAKLGAGAVRPSCVGPTR